MILNKNYSLKRHVKLGNVEEIQCSEDKFIAIIMKDNQDEILESIREMELALFLTQASINCCGRELKIKFTRQITARNSNQKQVQLNPGSNLKQYDNHFKEMFKNKNLKTYGKILLRNNFL